MLIGMALLLLTAGLMAGSFLTGAGAVTGGTPGRGVMACIGMGGSDRVVVGFPWIDSRFSRCRHLP